MLRRLIKPSTVSAVVFSIGTLFLLTRVNETRVAAQPGVVFGLDQLRAQLATLEAKVDKAQPRTFYLTVERVEAAQAPAACAAGHHMASIWELYDPSSLRYDATRGVTTADSGAGPPSDMFGWVRTGGDALGRYGEYGQGQPNCDGYASNRADFLGTVMAVESRWSDILGGGVTPRPWGSNINGCNLQVNVWCVRD